MRNGRSFSVAVAIMFTIISGVLLLCPDALGGTFYIANTGSDANTGTRTSPWAHIPGMPSCSANCKAYTPQPGDKFILRGGDVWTATDMGINWTYPGTATSPIYIGVDTNYYVGTTWARPILDCQGVDTCGGDSLDYFMIYAQAPYLTIDNIEFRGIYISTASHLPTSGIKVFNHDIEVKNCYFHGWSHATNAAYGRPTLINGDISRGGPYLARTSAHDNVIDGEDTSRDMMDGIDNIDAVYNNVVRYVMFGIGGQINDIHANLVEYITEHYVSNGISPEHCDMIFQYTTLYGTSAYFYNNVVRHMLGSGCAAGWISGLSGCTGCTIYAFNNVMYDNDLGFGHGIGIGGHPADSCDYGTLYFYNNTVQADNQECTGNGEPSGSYCGGLPRATVHSANNQCVTSVLLCNSSGAKCLDDGANLIQTITRANSLGYSTDQSFPFFPPTSKSETVGVGLTLTSVCTKAGVPALCYDTPFPTYDAVNHKVIMAKAPVPRPVTTGWDIGAYQYSGQASLPSPPSNLSVIVQ